MSVIFAGNELDSFRLRGNAQRVSVVASKFDSDFCRSAMEHGGGSADTGIARQFAGGTEFWFHFNVVPEVASNTSLDGDMFKVLDELNGITVFKLDGTNGVFLGSYWNGSSFTAMSNTISLIDDTITTIDINFKIHDTLGRIAIYVDGSLHEEFVGDTNLYSSAQIDAILLKSALPFLNWGFSYAFSEVIVADEATVGWRLATIVPNLAGATSAWTGAYTDVDEVTVDDSDYLESATANQVTTMGASDLSVAAAAMDIQAFGIVARSRKGGSGIQQVQAAVRTGGVDYFSATLPLDPGFIPVDAYWDVNPDTAAQWTASEIDGLELGVKSIT